MQEGAWKTAYTAAFNWLILADQSVFITMQAFKLQESASLAAVSGHYWA
jgi:hypothetical protein